MNKVFHYYYSKKGINSISSRGVGSSSGIIKLTNQISNYEKQLDDAENKITDLEKEYEYSKYIGNNISKNRNRANPNLDFVSFEKFNNIIRNRSFYGKINKEIKNNNSLNYSFEKSNTFYNSKKNLSNLVNNHNQNEEWFNNIDFENDNNIEKPKRKRPNSSKPNIKINREIEETSQIYSEPGFNVSYKTQKTKPLSGKARTNATNVSYSTNVLTTP